MGKTMWAFDSDETLAWSGDGPVTQEMLERLWSKGDILGICGNFHSACRGLPEDWHRLFSFVGQMLMSKQDFLHQIKTYLPPAERYVMVGNIQHRDGFICPDKEHARGAGWEFMTESAFARQMSDEAVRA